MTDEQQAKQGAETKTQDESMPSSEQQTTDSEDAEQASAQAEGDQQAKEPELPEGAKERTQEQFNKIRQQLSEERKLRLQLEQKMQQPKQEIDVSDTPEWYDPQTGEVDVTKLNRKEQQLSSTINQLNQQVTAMRQKEQIQQEQEAFNAYPGLDPDNAENFDKDFHDAVTGYLLSAYGRGDDITFKDAADKVMKLAKKETKEAQAKGAEEALESLSEKEQAALQAKGRSDQRTKAEANLKTLRRQSREGDDDAIAQRLANLKSVGK